MITTLSGAIEDCKLGEASGITVTRSVSGRWSVCPIGAAANSLGLSPHKIKILEIMGGIEAIWEYVVEQLKNPALLTLTAEAFSKDSAEESGVGDFDHVDQAIIYRTDSGEWSRADVVKWLRELGL